MLSCSLVLWSLQISSIFANLFVESDPRLGKKICTVKAIGNRTDDVPNILAAFSECGRGGAIVFPENQKYWIARRLHPIVEDVDIDWRGQWIFSDNLNYWRNNSYLIPFQNHRAGFILTGNNIHIDGHQEKIYSSTWPNINGNGDIWYTEEAGKTREGRPMPFVFWNVTNVTVENFHIKDPQLWALNIMNGTNLRFQNVKSNATATKAPYGENWVQNTDGFDTMDVRNATLKDFWYQGGDDCIAIKPRSHFILAENLTCHGGNGIAVGSLGQYLEDSSVTDVQVTDVKAIRYNEDMHNCAYIKTWIGVPIPQSSYESAGQPRGGGWGNITRINFSDFIIEGADAPPSITQDNGNNGSFSGTSEMLVTDVVFENFKGWLHKKSSKGSASCSKENPCDDVYFNDIRLTNGKYGPENVKGTCKYQAPGGVHGLGC